MTGGVAEIEGKAVRHSKDADRRAGLQEARRLFAASHAANPGDNRTLLQVQ